MVGNRHEDDWCMKCDARLKGAQTGRAVLSHSWSGSALYHFILNVKLIVLLRPETLDYTHNDSSSLLLGAVLADLTPGTQAHADICRKTEISSDNIRGDRVVR